MAKTNGSGAPRGRGHIRLGQVMVAEGVLTKRQLKRALAAQKKIGKGLGETIVELGLASETQIVAAFNNRYQSSLTSLGDDLDNWLRTRGIKAERGRFSFRIPIKTRLSVAVIFIIWATILGLSWVMFERQRSNLEQQTVRTGKVVLNNISNNAVFPLLNDDILQLNTLLKEAAKVEGVNYAVIVGRDGIVKGHTDPSRIRRPYQQIANRTSESLDGIYRAITYVTDEYHRGLDLGKLDSDVRQLAENVKKGDFAITLPQFEYMDQFGLGVTSLLKAVGLLESGTRMLDVSASVEYSKKVLGTVHVGISQDFIVEQIVKESVFIVLISVLLIVLGWFIAVVLAGGFSRPLDELVRATEEIGLGNLNFRIKKIRNDELGDLASAFNFMGGELFKKALMQESFGKYVGSDVLDLIMANPDSNFLKGTRSNVSVLFTDVRGFTSYSENRTPEEVVEALNEYFDIATRQIQEHGGYVDKFIGDAVMGVFGVPVARADHAEMAVRAALKMQDELVARAKTTGNQLLARVGIGINTGFAVSGNIGSQEKLEYTVIGDAVNVASRLNGLAKEGETVISADTRDAISASMNLESRPPQKVKGKSEAIETFKVVSIDNPAAAPQESSDAQAKTS